MNKKLHIFICLAICTLFSIKNSTAQCTWQTVLSDGFEYQTVCPDLIPGMTIHNVPQSFAVVSGSYSLYMNFTNCTGTSGACAGDTIYKRHFQVCRNMSYRFTTYLTTTFSGLQCDVRVVITDGNGSVLNLQPNVVCNYFPTLTAYNSGSVTTTSSDMYFILITNVGGSAAGNDLSMDDFLLEQCFPTSTTSSVTANICSNLSQQDLFSFLTTGSDTTGTWSGPGSLTNGYLGTFDVATSSPGTYAYVSPYYGTVTGCPLKTDSVAASIVTAPAPYIGNDTTICSTESLLLNAGSVPGASYQWSNGSITSTTIASTTILAGDTINYSVIVTDMNGCMGTDSMQIIFMNCTSINELDNNAAISILPNPVQDFIFIDSKNIKIEQVDIIDQSGRTVKTSYKANAGKIYVGDLPNAIYNIKIISGKHLWVRKFSKL